MIPSGDEPSPTGQSDVPRTSHHEASHADSLTNELEDSTESSDRLVGRDGARLDFSRLLQPSALRRVVGIVVAIVVLAWPDRTVLILGRLIDAELVARLRTIAGCQFSFTAVDSPDLGERERLALARITAMGGVEVLETNEGGAVACASFRDIRGFPAVIVRAPVERGELDLWGQLERYQLLTATAIAIFFPLILLVVFGLIALYFRMRGGYKPIELDTNVS